MKAIFIPNFLHIFTFEIIVDVLHRNTVYRFLSDFILILKLNFFQYAVTILIDIHNMWLSSVYKLKFCALPRIAVSNNRHLNFLFGPSGRVLPHDFAEIPAVQPASAAYMFECSFIRCTWLAKAYRRRYEYT